MLYSCTHMATVGVKELIVIMLQLMLVCQLVTVMVGCCDGHYIPSNDSHLVAPFGPKQHPST